MTKRQKQLLDFIAAYIGEHGICPSYDEMRDALGLKSKSNINRIVVALIDRGYLVRETGCGVRNLRLSADPNQAKQLICRLDESIQVYGDTLVDPQLCRAIRDFLIGAADMRSAT